MEDQHKPERSHVRPVKRPGWRLSRTRIVMILLLMIAIPIFVGLANKAARENADAIRQSLRSLGG
jgi:hypothetical protein